jgi:hypothetical protein
MTENELVIREMARQLLTKRADWMSFNAGDHEKFEFVIDCQNVIKGLLGLLDESRGNLPQSR